MIAKHKIWGRALLIVMMMLLVAACSGAAVPEPTEEQPFSVLPSLEPQQPDYPQWDSPPAMSIDPDKIYLATFETASGTFTIELFAEDAPLTVNNFVFLAEEGYYDNTTFHRVLADFMAQGGDPTGTGMGGPGYTFADEISYAHIFDSAGLLAMANSGPDTNGSQFFITYGPTPWLNGSHTIFGKLVDGMDVLLALRERDPQLNPTEPGEALLSVGVQEIGGSLLPTPTPTPIPVRPVFEEGRPFAALTVEERENLYTGHPEMIIDPALKYQARITTTQGEIVLELNALQAPIAVNNFFFLANMGYWDGFPMTFIEPGLFVLAGSPAQRPDSDIGYVLPAEGNLPNVGGAIGYWFRQDLFGGSGSQFYILIEDLPVLDDNPTIFGSLTAGLDVLTALTMTDSIISITAEIVE